MAYYSYTFNTLHKPKNSESFNDINFKQLYEFLDYLFLFLDLDAKKFDYSFKSPKNLLMSYTDKDFRVFVGDEKAIAELNNIVYQTRQQKKLVSLDEANQIGIRQLGYKFDCYFDIDILNFQSAISFVEHNFDKTEPEKLKILGNTIKKVTEFSNDVPATNAAFFNCWVQVSKQITSEFERKNGVMDINPRFKARGIVVNPSQCFYVMQFKDKDIQEAHDAIVKKLNDELSLDVIKSGDIFDPHRGNDMVENIWQDIMQSKFIIADLSKRNPNVFYELGICDTVGKTVIPICSETSFNEDYKGKFPFDIQQEYTIIYKNGFRGISKLQDDVLKRATAITRGAAINTQK